MNKLDQAREQVFYADITAQLAARAQRGGDRAEALIRLLGLWGSDLDFKLPNALPVAAARAQTSCRRSKSRRCAGASTCR